MEKAPFFISDQAKPFNWAPQFQPPGSGKDHLISHESNWDSATIKENLITVA